MAKCIDCNHKLKKLKGTYKFVAQIDEAKEARHQAYLDEAENDYEQHMDGIRKDEGR